MPTSDEVHVGRSAGYVYFTLISQVVVLSCDLTPHNNRVTIAWLVPPPWLVARGCPSLGTVHEIPWAIIDMGGSWREGRSARRGGGWKKTHRESAVIGRPLRKRPNGENLAMSDGENLAAHVGRSAGFLKKFSGREYRSGRNILRVAVVESIGVEIFSSCIISAIPFFRKPYHHHQRPHFLIPPLTFLGEGEPILILHILPGNSSVLFLI